MRSPNGPSTSHIRLIVSTVLCGSSAWHQGLKEIGRVASVQFAVCYLLLPPLSENPSFSDQYGGWMWKVERFAASGQPIGVGNTWRSFPWFRPSNRCCLLPAPSCHSFSSPLELAGSTRPQCLVGTTATVCQRRWRSCLSSYEVKTTKEKLAAKKTFSLQGYNPLSGSAGRGSCVSFPQNLPFFSRGFLMS